MGLKVKVDGDGSGFSATLDKLSKDAANFGSTLNSKISGNFSEAIMGVVPGLTGAIAGVFSAEAIKESLSRFAEAGEKIEFGSIRLNVDPETYQRLNKVMTEVGGDIGTVETSFDKLADALTKMKLEPATQETMMLKQAFAALGVTTDDLAGKDYRAIFFQIAQGMKDITPGPDQISGLRTVFGKGGDNLLPALKMGFDSPTASAGMLDKEQFETIKQYNDTMRQAGDASADVWNKTKEVALSYFGLIKVGLNPFFWASKAGTTNEGEGWTAQKNAEKVRQIDAAKAKAKADAENADALAKKTQHDDEKKASAINKETTALRERNREAAMTPEEKRIKLLKEISDMQGMRQNFGAEMTESEDAALRKKIEEAKGELFKMDRAKKSEKSIMARMAPDSHGGFLANHPDDLSAKSHRAKVEKHLASIDSKTKPPAGRGPANRDYV